MLEPLEKLKLQGFNNLTKTLSLNIYHIHYADGAAQGQAYIEYIDETYNARRLSRILADLAGHIGASILHLAQQDYEPQGASATLMIAEEPMTAGQPANTTVQRPSRESLVAHLDKSHLTAHTYPEAHPDNGICTTRIDIDVSTCGLVSPLKALNYLIDVFGAAVLSLDYRIRGFTRDQQGRKHFIDRPVRSIQDYLSRDNRERYQAVDLNLYAQNIFHTRMMLKGLRLADHLFRIDRGAFSEREQAEIAGLLHKEMDDIFRGRDPSVSGD